MFYRLFFVSTRARQAGMIAILLAMLLLSGCAAEDVRQIATGTAASVLATIIVCAAFHLCVPF